jgi:hypothetical protein
MNTDYVLSSRQTIHLDKSAKSADEISL